MYTKHFGLDRRLFQGGIAQEELVYCGDAQRTLAERLAVALHAPDAAVLLHGPAGTGKTTLAAHALRAASTTTRIACIWLSTPPPTPYDLLELLLTELGFEAYRRSRVERLQTWRQYLTELGATGTRVFVAAERAHELETGVLQALDTLTAADPAGCPGANLILMSQSAPAGRYESPELASLGQRIRLVGRVEPLAADDVEAYVRHGAACAGADADALFGPDAFRVLAAYSGGIPRRLNSLCDTALAVAAGRGDGRVTGSAVEYAAVELCGLPAQGRPDSDAAGSEPAGSREAPGEATDGDAADPIPVLTEWIDDAPDTEAPPHEARGEPDSDAHRPASAAPPDDEDAEDAEALERRAAALLADGELDALGEELTDAFLALGDPRSAGAAAGGTAEGGGDEAGGGEDTLTEADVDAGAAAGGLRRRSRISA